MILKGKSIIMMASASYVEPTKAMLNVHVLADELSKAGNKVLFVESVGLKGFKVFLKKDFKKIFIRFLRFAKYMFLGPFHPKPNVWVIPAIKLPFEKYSFIKSFNEKIITWVVKRASKRILDPKPIIWSFLPIFPYLKKKVDHSLFIYHAVDDFTENPFVDKREIMRKERAIIGVADLIFVISNKLYKKFKAINDEKVIYHLPNVARYELFHKAITETNHIPKEMKRIVDLKKPIVGYMGSFISYKENIKLFHDISQNCPEYSFVIIGQHESVVADKDIAKIKKLSNVFLLGPKDYFSLYRYFRYYDVAIIPRFVSKYSEGGFPLKYFEFLSAGLPTIITGLGSVSEFSKFAKLGGVANTPEEFKKRIKYWIEMKERRPQEFKQCVNIRTRLAKQNSWERRIPELDKIISQYIRS